jgi:hypothetical protein
MRAFALTMLLLTCLSLPAWGHERRDELRLEIMRRIQQNIDLLHEIAARPLPHPNEFWWTACQLGNLVGSCTILVTDALAGEPEAQFRLAVLLTMGGSDQDLRDAKILLAAAAEQGHPGAQRLLGMKPPPPTPRARRAPPPPAPADPMPSPERIPAPLDQQRILTAVTRTG